MRKSNRTIAWGLAPLAFAAAVLAAFPVLAISDTFETAPERDPADALQVPLSGPGYSLIPPARPEDGLRVYTLQQGAETATLKGDGLALQRLKEISVLEGLKQAQASKSFVDGLKQAAEKPVEFVQSTVKDPIGTAKSTATGVGKVLGRITTGVEKAVTGEMGSPGEFARTITGQAEARRELAVNLGVDPYTTYTPLSEALDQAATVSTAGSMSVNAVLALVPGGIAMNVLGTSENLRQAVIRENRDELLARISGTLQEQGVDGVASRALLQNPHFTPTELGIIAYHLREMPDLKDKTILINQAASVTTRAQAYAELRRFALLLEYHRTRAPLNGVRLVAGQPMAITSEGAAFLALPLDTVAWTQPMASRFVAINEELERSPFPPTRIELIMPGDMTDLAAERLTSFGWDVTATFPMPDSVIH